MLEGIDDLPNEGDPMEQYVKNTTIGINANRLEKTVWTGPFRVRNTALRLMQYIQFVMFCIGLGLTADDFTLDLIAPIFINVGEGSIDVNTEIHCLQVFAEIYSICINMLIIGDDGKEIKQLNNPIKPKEQLFHAFVFFDKNKLNYFPLYMTDTNNCQYSIFSDTDTYVIEQYQQFVNLVEQPQTADHQRLCFPAFSSVEELITSFDCELGDGNPDLDSQNSYPYLHTPNIIINETVNQRISPSPMNVDFQGIEVHHTPKNDIIEEQDNRHDYHSCDKASGPSSRTMPIRPLEETHEFRQERITGDDSCLFTSVRFVLHILTTKTNDDLRNEVVNQIRNSETLQQAIPGEFPGYTTDRYCNRILGSQAWGGDIELRALALTYKKLICVVSVHTNDSSDRVVDIYRFGEDLPKIMECVYILYTGANHYDALYLSEKGSQKHGKTIFSVKDYAVQEALRKFIQYDLGASNHHEIQLDNIYSDLSCELETNTIPNSEALSSSIKTKATKRKRIVMDESPLSSNPVQVKRKPVSCPPTEVLSGILDHNYCLSDQTIPIQHEYDPPKISIEPKAVQRGRQIKELRFASLQGAVGAKHVHKSIQIEVKSLFPNPYLGCAVFTYDNQPHPSKFILPMNTTLDYPKDKFSKNAANKLEYFKFSQCETKEYLSNEDDLKFIFHKKTKHIYSSISTPGLKNISVRMVKMYHGEDNGIDRKLIEKNQLSLCRLGFWLCQLRNEVYEAVSPISFSQIIREKKDKSAGENKDPTMNVNLPLAGVESHMKDDLSISDGSSVEEDIHTLTDNNWLNDQVINSYLTLISHASEVHRNPRVYSLSTFFYTKLIKDGPKHESWDRYVGKVDFSGYDLILIPIHLNNHWILITINFREKRITSYDSLGHKNETCLDLVTAFVKHMYALKKPKVPTPVDWFVGWVTWIPQQSNTNDCGVFVCQYGKYLAQQRQLDFTPADIPRFRDQMIKEIRSNTLII